MSDEYLFDSRDARFALFEHLKVQRLFELPQFADFTPSDVDMMLTEGLKFAKTVMGPINRIGDTKGCRWEDGKVYAPAEFKDAYKKMYEAGWMSVASDAEYGGQGLPSVVGACIGEMFVGANCSLAMISGLTRGAALLLRTCASKEMYDKYLPKLIDGTWQGTMCLTEPHAGSAVGALTTSAKREGDHYKIRGNKIFISGGEHDMVENVIHLVLARVEGAVPGIKGVSLFLVPKYLVNEDGTNGEFNDVHCVGIEHKMGINGSPTCAMSYGENDNCIGWIIGEEGEGIKHMFRMMNDARIGVGLQGTAMGGWAYLAALQYAQERKQGVEMKNLRDPNAPQVVITKHPDVRRMLATMKAYSEGGRALLLYASMGVDLSEFSPDEAERLKAYNRVELLTPIVKAWCSDTGFEASSMAIQTFGGHGYLRDYPVEQLARDSRIAAIYEGTNGIQAIDLLGRKVARDQGAHFIDLMTEVGKFVATNKDHATLKSALAAFQNRKEQLEQTTMKFGMMQMSGDMAYPLLSATHYLRMFGNVVVAWLLLEQAVIAQEQLDKIIGQSGVTNVDEAVLADNDEARFYYNKVKTAQFFVGGILSQNDGLLAIIESEDRSALEMAF